MILLHAQALSLEQERPDKRYLVTSALRMSEWSYSRATSITPEKHRTSLIVVAAKPIQKIPFKGS